MLNNKFKIYRKTHIDYQKLIITQSSYLYLNYDLFDNEDQVNVHLTGLKPILFWFKNRFIIIKPIIGKRMWLGFNIQPI